jgi:hypothetical protein
MSGSRSSTPADRWYRRIVGTAWWQLSSTSYLSSGSDQFFVDLVDRAVTGGQVDSVIVNGAAHAQEVESFLN